MDSGRSSHPQQVRVIYVRTWQFWSLLMASAMIGAAGAGCSVVFFIVYTNQAAGMWALSAAIFSFAAVHLHILNLFDNLPAWHDAQSLTQIKFLALGVCALSTIGGAVFGSLALRSKQEIIFGGNNFVVSTIAAGLSLLSGLVLLLTAILYRKHIREASDRLLIEEPGPSHA